MPKIIKNGKIIGSSPSALSGLQDTDIQSPTSGQILEYDGSKWANSSALDDKQDYVADGSYTVYGIWSETYYSSARIWVPFPQANEYTISITRGRYRSGNSQMTDINSDLIGIASGSESALGFLVYAALDAAAGHYGQVNFTVTRN